MFDVSWVHPKTETVGERRTRKEYSTNVSRRTSIHGSKFTESPPSKAKTSLLNIFGGAPYHSDELSNPSEVSGSVFSGRTGRSTKTDSTWSSVESTTSGRIVQPLSPTSFVRQSTEVTVSPRDSVKGVEQLATVVRISSPGTIPIHVYESPIKTSPPSATFEFPVPDPNQARRRLSVASKNSQGSRSTIAARERQPDCWKPPETWKCPEDEELLPKATLPNLLELPLRSANEKKRDVCRKRQKLPPVEIQLLQTIIRRVEAATPKIILERLKEEWVEIADASVYRELELEKQLWMLSALRGLKNKSSMIPDVKTNIHTSEITKILSLFENHASCSILSALTTANEVHHLSPSPLSPKSYPNVHPLSVPGPASQLPYASNTFTSIHAFCLPTLLPAASIPLLLKECHRTLKSPPSPPSSTAAVVHIEPEIRGGTLHLTILDPSPLPATLGPRLRAWLDSHLIVNLERQFRCINPSRLFPIWLADAGLRAEGSTIFNVRFFASVSEQVILRAGEVDAVETTKQELKSIVGRMLWKEMWGGYVEGEKWWWEDESVVEECERMGTCWEYAVIEGVKEG